MRRLAAFLCFGFNVCERTSKNTDIQIFLDFFKCGFFDA